MRLNNFTNAERNSGILYINIYYVADYPRIIKISKAPYDDSFSPGKWKKRIGSFVYYYGNELTGHFEEININNSLFGAIFRKYLLEVLSENINEPWDFKELKSNLTIVKDISDSYKHSDKIKLQYVLIIGVHHWQNTNFGIIVDLKVNIIERVSDKRISYPEIKDKYGESVRESIWSSVQAFHKHLTPNGKKYATAMRDKFNLLTALIKEAFGSLEDEISFETPDGDVKILFKPLEVVEVADDDAI